MQRTLEDLVAGIPSEHLLDAIILLKVREVQERDKRIADLRTFSTNTHAYRVNDGVVEYCSVCSAGPQHWSVSSFDAAFIRALHDLLERPSN